jgi:sec-independent protein translocase protein TatC
MSLLQHLEELRLRLIRCIIAVIAGVLLGYFLAPWPLAWLTAPLIFAQREQVKTTTQEFIRIEVAEDGTLRLIATDLKALAEAKTTPAIAFHRPGVIEPEYVLYSTPTSPLVYLRPMDPFMIRLKAAVVLGVLFALPLILWEIWSFVAPGLVPAERRFAVPVIAAGTILFPIGASFAYFMLGMTLQVLSAFSFGDTPVMNDATEYLSFVLMMMLAFGIVFELPVGIVIATRLGLVSVAWLASRRRYVFVVLLLLAAVVTPTQDPITLFAMALPLYVLFEASLIVSRFLERPSAAVAVGEGGS